MKREYSIETNEGKIYPLGVTKTQGGFDVAFVSEKKPALLLFEKGSRKRMARLAFPENARMGNVHYMTVKGDFTGLEYAFEEEEKEIPDPFGTCFTGREKWGDEKAAERALHTPFEAVKEDFDWEEDRRPEIPANECIVYKIHPRGFSKHASFKGESWKRGTFGAIADKIPYMKELGITTVEMMPPVEFDEVMEDVPRKINYWGYCCGHSFAPKAAYAGAAPGQKKDPIKEFKTLVKALHKAGLELVIELYFDGTQSPSYVVDVLRFWAAEYHVDGIHIVGYAPLETIVKDPYLADLKLWAKNWDEVRLEKGTDRSSRAKEEKKGPGRRLSAYETGFMLDMRSFLKGDEGMLNQVALHVKDNPDTVASINYMANTNGFTLLDMVSYDHKHNEDNGEENHDGTDYNQSWNCGAEGPVRKKKILALRKRQLKNALTMLFLSQGTPLIMAGDEFGRTQKGNNNAYCQDNEISWLNWNLSDAHKGLYEFAKELISFRKKHSLFHRSTEPTLMDHKSVGLPDVSFHGEKAWCPDFERYSRQLGVFYSASYGENADGSEEPYFYTAYNMHWEPHTFALPNLPSGYSWHQVLDTAEDNMNGFLTEGKEKLLDDQKEALVLARSIQVFAGLKCPEKKAVVQIQKHSGSRAGKRIEIKAEIKTEIKTEAENATKTETKAETKTEIKAEMKRKGPKENRKEGM